MTQESTHQTGFVYDTKRKKYISQKTGKVVKAALVLTILRKLIQDAEDRQHKIAVEFYEGRIAPATFVETMRTEQRRNTILCIALAAGGFALLTQAMLSKAEFALQEVFVKIVGSTWDVINGKVSLAQLMSRINGYVGAARSLYYKTLRDNAPALPDDMVTIEKRVLGDADHCEQCPEYASWGWQLAGEIPLPSEQCDCEDHCRCHNVSQDVPRAELDQWITKEKTVVAWTPKRKRYS